MSHPNSGCQPAGASDLTGGKSFFASCGGSRTVTARRTAFFFSFPLFSGPNAALDPVWARSSRSGNTSGVSMFGTLANAAWDSGCFAQKGGLIGRKAGVLSSVSLMGQ